MSWYKKYKKYKFKYLYLLYAGNPRLLAKEHMIRILETDKNEGLRQLRRVDRRKMASNRKYLDFYEQYLWNSKVPILTDFSRKVLDIDSINISWITNIVSYINFGLTDNKLISDSTLQTIENNIKSNHSILNKEKIYLDLLVFLYRKTFQEIEIENELIREEKKQQDKKDKEEYEFIEKNNNDIPDKDDLEYEMV